MSDSINSLAIVITKHIERDIINVWTGKDRDVSPSFYNILEKVLSILKNYMDEFAYREVYSPETEKQFRDEILQQIKKDRLRKAAGEFVETWIKSPDHFENIEFKDAYGRYASVRRSIIVLKTAKINTDSDQVKP